MRTIESIIFDELASHRAVLLPGVGVLGVVRQAARGAGGVPSNGVVLAPEGSVGAPSLFEAGVSQDDYARWRADAVRGDEFVIDGVGRIVLGEFTASGELHKALNPASPTAAATPPVAPPPARSAVPARGPVEHKPRNPQRYTNTLLIIAIVLLGLLLITCWTGRFGVTRTSVAVLDPQPIEERQVVPVPVYVPELDPVSDTVAVPAPVAKRYHLIAGSFDNPARADELAVRMRRDYPDLNVLVIRNTTGRTLVSVYQGDTERAAYNRFYRIAEQTGNWDMWVYKAVE